MSFSYSSLNFQNLINFLESVGSAQQVSEKRVKNVHSMNLSLFSLRFPRLVILGIIGAQLLFLKEGRNFYWLT